MGNKVWFKEWIAESAVIIVILWLLALPPLWITIPFLVIVVIVLAQRN